jgi:lipopolysaccharide export system protein LptA
MSRWCWAIPAGLLLLFASPSLFAQGDPKLVVLQGADSLIGRVINGQAARELIGNVRILQGNVRIRCDRALQMIDAGSIELIGHVVVEDDSVTLTAPRGFYYRDTRRAEAFGAVKLTDGLSTLEAAYGEYFIEPRLAFFRTRVVAHDSASILNADSARYDRNRRFTEAWGRVVLVQKEDAITISGGRFTHDAMQLHSTMSDEPVLVQRDTSGGVVDTLVVRSRVMESFRDSTRRLIAQDSVEIVRRDLAGRAGTVTFHTAGDSIRMRTTPVLWYDQTQVTGDSINLYMRARVLDRIHVMGNAFALSESDSAFAERYDQLSGETLGMQFRDKRLSRIDVDVRATSLYFVYEDSAANGLNKTSGDRIVMRFADGKVETIHVYGGVEGQYFPEPLVRRKVEEYRLPGYQRLDNRPRMRASDHGPARSLRDLPH